MLTQNKNNSQIKRELKEIQRSNYSREKIYNKHKYFLPAPSTVVLKKCIIEKFEIIFSRIVSVKI